MWMRQQANKESPRARDSLVDPGATYIHPLPMTTTQPSWLEHVPSLTVRLRHGPGQPRASAADRGNLDAVAHPELSALLRYWVMIFLSLLDMYADRPQTVLSFYRRAGRLTESNQIIHRPVHWPSCDCPPGEDWWAMYRPYSRAQ